MTRRSFPTVAEEFIEFARDAQLIIHNAPFDVAFPRRGMKRADLPAVGAVVADVIDTLAMARDHFPARKTVSTRCARIRRVQRS